MINPVFIDQTKISLDSPPYIIAEIGNNHNGNLDLGLRLISEAKRCGADAVKLQTKNIEKAFSQELLNKSYSGENSFGNTYREHKEALELSFQETKTLFDYAKKIGITPFSTPFDIESIKLLEKLNPPVYKISSFHVVDLPLIKELSRLNKPIIISTGMSTNEEIDTAVNTVKEFHDQLIVLHCVSAYPTEDNDVNLSRIPFLAKRYDSIVGYSGHERGVTICTASIPLGGRVIERHFTLDRTMKGPDHAASIEPTGLELICKHAKQIFSALGESNSVLNQTELVNRKKFRGY